MNSKMIYLVLCVLGFVIPYSQFVPWVVAQRGIPLGLFVHELLANRVSAFFGLDVLVSSVVLLAFMRAEAQRPAARQRWLPIAALCLVGVSLAFPLYLYLREDALHSGANLEQ